MALAMKELGLCPYCKAGKLLAVYRVTLLPNYGQVFMLTLRCDNCGLRIPDIIFIREHGENPVEHRVKVTRERMGDLLVISAGSTVSCPQLEFDVYFGLGEIKTVEGMLREMLEKAEEMLDRASGDARAKLERIVSTLKRELEKPSGSLELVVRDERRYSTIVPREIWEKRAELEREMQKRGLPLKDEWLENYKKLLKEYKHIYESAEKFG